MLLELRVENYAVIDSLAVEFATGLNLLTGETGAGKSILIDALSLLLGDKASTEMIRHGAEKAVVSGVFEADEKRLGAGAGRKRDRAGRESGHRQARDCRGRQGPRLRQQSAGYGSAAARAGAGAGVDPRAERDDSGV